MKIFVIFFLMILYFSCKKYELEKDTTDAIKASVCDINYPVRELPWLHKLIEDAKDEKVDKILTIKLVEVNGKPIFNYYLSYSSCMGCINYQCDGSMIDVNKLPAAEIQEFKDKIISGQGKVTILWPEE
ncbi:hypothetical protein L0657_04230 [Dyadobacter sp. CY345]|uniref:hypothetical protein n=1 Tax=Dyadobacter sp. CY345 TaxID=2909335 RepID=UPI001F1E3A96|nr:hypothetical protein [Dyadobacter sp. CY345]MCF2443155.1 hypothetical protein [Dyadobacter sp. CY345]